MAILLTREQHPTTPDADANLAGDGRQLEGCTRRIERMGWAACLGAAFSAAGMIFTCNSTLVDADSRCYTCLSIYGTCLGAAGVSACAIAAIRNIPCVTQHCRR